MPNDAKLSTSELLEALAAIGATKTDLERWIRQGMPFGKNGRRREFDRDEVEEWLISAGVVDVSEVVYTQGDVANALGVSLPTVQKWIRQGMPCRPGSRGRSGRYDVAEIREWLAARDVEPLGDDDGELSPKHELDRLNVKYKRLQIALMERDAVDIAALKELLAVAVIGPLQRLRDDLAKTPHAAGANRTIEEIISACETLDEDPKQLSTSAT